ncbi:hypothetical protein CCP4SC76_3920001 [Gammaproteobacteria bacterium]
MELPIDSWNLSPAEARRLQETLRERVRQDGTPQGLSRGGVSIGHRMELSRAIQWALNCTGRYRLPETTRFGHPSFPSLHFFLASWLPRWSVGAREPENHA